MTAYFINDVPNEPLNIVPTRDGEPVDLDTFDDAEVLIEGTAVTATLGAEAVSITWPSTSLFEEAGLHLVTVRLTAAGDVVETFDAEPIVVQALDGWHSLGSARREQAVFKSISDVNLYTLLSAARYAVENFAPALTEDASLPLRYRQAQLMQARNLLNAAKVTSNGDLGEDSYALSTRPLDWHVKALLRPQRGTPVVG